MVRVHLVASLFRLVALLFRSKNEPEKCRCVKPALISFFWRGNVKKLIFLLLTAVLLTGFVSAQDDGGAPAEFTLAGVLSGNIAEDCVVKPDSVSISSTLFSLQEKTIDEEKQIIITWLNIDIPCYSGFITASLGKEVDGVSRYSEPMLEII